jgi:predicted ribonuclease YlaK
MADLTRHIQNIKKTFDFTLNESQLRSINDWLLNKHLFLSGVAGSGKTWIAIYLAVLSVLNKEHDDIIVVRSLVPTRNIGFLPGEVVDKAKPFLEFYESIFLEVLSAFSGKNSDRDFMKNRVHFENTSFLRGKTWDNSVIYIDEVQNLNTHELHTVMTRVGKNSRVIVSGDYFQSDLSHRESCHEFLEAVVNQLSSFSQVNFYIEDIVRSDFVKDWCEIAEAKLLTQ